MTDSTDDIKQDIIYRAAMTFKHEELAGMYAIINRREIKMLHILSILVHEVEIRCRSDIEVEEFHKRYKELLKDL